MSDITELQLQKLVDGELSHEERGRLLDHLAAGQQADGWKSVALAFLESQQLGSTLSAASPMGVENTVTRSRRSRPLRFLQQSAALAASALLGVSVVLVGHSYFRGTGDAMVTNVANDPAAANVAPADEPLVAEASIDQTLDNLPQGTQARVARPVPVMNVNLGGGGNGDGPTVSVPVYSHHDWAAASADAEHAGRNETDAWQRELEEQGYQVNREVEWIIHTLEDGTRVLIPTERMQVEPALK